MKITISASALDDLADILRYYRDEGAPHIGRRFQESIIEHIESLHDNPDIGRIVPEFGDEKLRELIHAPFRIVYLRELETLRVIRIWRGERLLMLPDTHSENKT